MREGMTKDSKFTVPSNPEAQARIAKLVDQMQGGIPGKGKRAATSDVPPLANLNYAQAFSQPQALTPGPYLLRKTALCHSLCQLLVLLKF